MLWRSRTPVALLLALAACGTAPPRPGEVRISDAPAPLQPEAARLPRAHAHWMPDAVYGGRVYVMVAGPAQPQAAPLPTLVLVHGLGDAGVRDFFPLLPQLTQRRRVVLFDLPGFGRSTQANVKYTPEGFAAVLSRVIESYASGPVDVMGHSMGGAISLLHAATYPAQVRRLVVVDAAGILHREALVGQHLRRFTDPTSLLFPGIAAWVGDAAGTVAKGTRLLDPAPEMILEMALLRKKLLGGQPGRIAALSLILYNFGPALARIETPTLLIWGEADNVAPLRTGQFLADRVRGAQLAVLPGVGHNVMAEAPAALLARAEPHLDTPAGMQAASPAAAASQGAGTCSGQPDAYFSGVYDSIVLDNCPRATLDGVRSGKLVVRRSSARVVRCTLTGGIAAESSEVIVTGGRVDGDVPLQLDGSRVDLAGVAIEAGVAPYRMKGESRLLFSVCPVHTRAGLAFMHGLFSSSADGAAGAEAAPAGGSY